ncbi:LOW QUALITY PROTEIN: uncharacterized protein C1orf50 homolog [Colletes gigas]|uniref:LOW QUALITY PROTEIN: uncharacterized protein C1orf50 homolog n=1 Tax=Colletes gigas TaxID=935657 RepID=UPI001C9BA267|nr:LOW QUALITY PROTEIN: uncharacterized protein C1orf50 homolog [Colletes gigas]
MDKSNNLLSKVALVERNTEPQGIPLNNPEAVAKSTQEDLIALAMEIQKADSFVKVNACSKLQVIAEQIRSLKKQAETILLTFHWNMKLYHVACNFVKHLGHVYHLYQQETGQLYFSMLSPEEWGNSGPPQIYKGAYRLEQDHSWSPLQKIDAKNKEMAMVAKLLSNIPATASAFKSIDLNVNM